VIKPNWSVELFSKKLIQHLYSATSRLCRLSGARHHIQCQHSA